jgi:hypothetical protein
LKRKRFGDAEAASGVSLPRRIVNSDCLESPPGDEGDKLLLDYDSCADASDFWVASARGSFAHAPGGGGGCAGSAVTRVLFCRSRSGVECWLLQVC